MASQRRDDKGIPTSIYVVRRSEPHPLGLPFLPSSLPSDSSSTESSASANAGGDTDTDTNTATAIYNDDDNSDNDEDFAHTHAQARRRLNTNSPTAILEAAIALQEAESEAAAQLCSAELAEAVQSDNDDTVDHDVEVADAVTEVPADAKETAEDEPAQATATTDTTIDTTTTTTIEVIDTNTTTTNNNDDDDDDDEYSDYHDDDEEDDDDQFDGESSFNKYLVDDFHFHMHLRRGSTSRVHLKHEATIAAVNVKTCRNDGHANANAACKHYRPYPHLQFVNLCQCQRHKLMHVAAA